MLFGLFFVEEDGAGAGEGADRSGGGGGEGEATLSSAAREGEGTVVGVNTGDFTGTIFVAATVRVGVVANALFASGLRNAWKSDIFLASATTEVFEVDIGRFTTVSTIGVMSSNSSSSSSDEEAFENETFSSSSLGAV